MLQELAPHPKHLPMPPYLCALNCPLNAFVIASQLKQFGSIQAAHSCNNLRGYSAGILLLSSVLHADKSALFEHKNSEASPCRMSIAFWIKQLPGEVSQVLQYTEK